MSIQPIYTQRLALKPFSFLMAQVIFAFNTGILAEIGLQPTRFWPDQESMDSLPRPTKRFEKLGIYETARDDEMIFWKLPSPESVQ